MTPTVFFLILASVLLHAGWHFLSKQQRGGMAFFLLISFGSLAITSPFTLCSGVDFSLLPAKFWLFAALGGLCGVICNSGLSFGYRAGDVSLVYPMARALPVLLTAAVTEIAYLVLGYGAPLSLPAIIGMVVVFAGCLIMPAKDFKHLTPKYLFKNKAMPWIAIAAFGTTGYTVFDKAGLDLLLKYGNANSTILGSCAYSTIREIFLFFFLFTAVLLIPHERAGLTKDLPLRWPGYISGIFAAIAYILVLIAMHMVENVSYIQAFRQMSLPVGVFLGVFFLKEKAGLPKIIGLILIVAGLAATALLK
ncbi:MAG: hypothetical protein J6Q65_01710 [Lentisphaeria bacterium]|nr:hypothetical protein [Lentisphaeria bacterium]